MSRLSTNFDITNSSCSAQKIYNMLNENGNDSALRIEKFRGISRFHMLTICISVRLDPIIDLLNSSSEGIFCLNN